MRLLVATDLTSLSDRAVERAFLLARGLGAELVIRHVVEAALPVEQRAHAVEWAKSGIAREIKRLALAGERQPQVEIVTGDPCQAITAGVDSDVILLGTHCESRQRGKRFAESTAGRALMSTPGAVLLVQRPVDGPYRRVVIGVDFSAQARAALRLVARIASSAELLLVHAYQVPFQGLVRSNSFAGSVADAEQSQMDDFLAEAVELPGFDRTKVEAVLREGEPADVLRNACDAFGASLLVIGTHRREGLSRAIWGSVASNLLEVPPCDVLVMEQP